MKKNIPFSLLILLITLQTNAQDFLPFASSNYAGITGIHLQPASIADSRYRFDLALSSTSIGITNNYLGIDPYVLSHPNLLQDLDFNGKYISRNINGESKSMILSLKQDIFSFMISLSPKSAIAFTPSVRTIMNLDNFSESLATQLNDINNENLWGIPLKNNNLNAELNAWVEYGFTYARVLVDKEKHFLKAGATLKINQGLGSAFLFAKKLDLVIKNQDTISLNTEANYGSSDNLEDNFKYRFDANPSLSFDFGFVYEFRPQWMKYKYDMDGKTNLWRRDQDKYLLRIGFTASDMGSVRFRRNPQSKDFKANIENLDINNTGIESISDFNHYIDSIFDVNHNMPDSYKMSLPACFSMQADIRVFNGFYVNFTPYLALNRTADKVNKVHYLTAYNIVPRFDKKMFGVSVPFQYNAYKQWNIGLGLRIGSFWIGSNDIFSMLASSKFRYGSSVSVVLKVPFFYGRPQDKDNDNVSDKKDKCPKIAGLYSLDGCPDADNDGITDAKDKCPDIAGLKEFEGCPDTDEDGIIDQNDLCPNAKGEPKFNGCPDSDGDGIIDQDDLCPKSAGLIKMQGCPDQDDDGITDKDDNCPTVAGTRENKGCPYIDSDGDGIIDESDNCPGTKGPIENHGCPYLDSDTDSIPDKDDDCPSISGLKAFNGCPDTDADGISDKYDLCPTIPGIAQNNGCPEIKKEEQEILKKAFDNLEFETGKSVIKKASLASLDGLADVMKKRSEFKLSLSGHTDNVGKPESNLTLSKNRTMAVKNYLVKKGVEPDRIKTDWFGQTQPVADNTTPEGRQKNRRVEMKIVFE